MLVQRLFARRTRISQYQKSTILGFIGAKDDGSGGDNWSYKTCKAPAKSFPPSNQHPTFYRPDAVPVAQPTVSEHWREVIKRWECFDFSLLYWKLTNWPASVLTSSPLLDLRESFLVESRAPAATSAHRQQYKRIIHTVSQKSIGRFFSPISSAIIDQLS